MTDHTEALDLAIVAAGLDPRNPAVRQSWQAGIEKYLEEIDVHVKDAMKRLYTKLAEEGGGNWAVDVIMDVERILASASPSAGGETVKGDLDDATIVKLARENFSEKDYERLTHSKSEPLIPQETFDVPTLSLLEFVKAVRAATPEAAR